MKSPVTLVVSALVCLCSSPVHKTSRCRSASGELGDVWSSEA